MSYHPTSSIICYFRTVYDHQKRNSFPESEIFHLWFCNSSLIESVTIVSFKFPGQPAHSNLRTWGSHLSCLSQRRVPCGLSATSSPIDNWQLSTSDVAGWRRWLTTVSCLSATTSPIDRSDGIPIPQCFGCALCYCKIFWFYCKILAHFPFGL